MNDLQIEQTNGRANAHPERRVSLRADGLTKRFGDFVAVDHLSLEVYDGEVFGFLGPNGAGKTTSISLMCGLLQGDGGQALVYGRPMSATDPDTRARVGVCPQHIVLWPRLTCIEQLEFMGEMYGVPREKARRKGDALLEALGLQEKRTALAKTLSGGMQRRLSIALALVHEPDIVVLDEPEAGLDPQSRILVREYILDLARRQQKTVIFTTHNMDEADRVSDRVAIIDHGKLLKLDTPTRLKHTVGKGDTLELGLPTGTPPEVLERLRAVFPDAQLTEDAMVLRALHMVEQLPGVLETMKAAGTAPTRLSLRESTLEDVFIALTGRGLRP